MTEPRPRSPVMGDKADKYETLRRLRFGDLLRLFRHRWGHVLPDDDAGRGDLWLLVTNCSLAAAEPEKKMAHVIEVWAPWMSPEELAAYVQHVWGLDLYQRIQTARELGEQLGLTNATREALKLWRFLPIDKTDDELAEQRAAKRREKAATRRRARGVRPREDYLATLPSRQRPWEAEGTTRRTWERRRSKRVASALPTIVSSTSSPLATQRKVEVSEVATRQVRGVSGREHKRRR